VTIARLAVSSVIDASLVVGSAQRSVHVR
jgi:hypothetical protein